MKVKTFLLLGIASVILSGCGRQEVKTTIDELTVNYRKNPIGIETVPVFSWKMKDDTEGQKQSSYRIVVAASEKDLKKGNYVWDSGENESAVSVAIPYEGEELAPETCYYWKVFVKDKDGKEIVSSEKAYFETGILDDDWDNAQWIYYDNHKISNEYVSQSPAYTISYDLKMDSSYSGIMWGADTNCYGEYYLWAFDTRTDEVELVTSRRKNETALEEKRCSLTEIGITKDGFLQNEHKIKIEVNGTNVDTYLDSSLIAHEEIAVAREMGLLGLWVDRGAYYAYYDNISISNANGEILCQEDFEDRDNNIFSPFYTKISDGWIEASSGVIMTAGGEEPAPMFRKSFQTIDDAQIETARLYITSLGTYEAYLNGEEVSDEYFAPGVSYYGKEVFYRTYDVTEFVQNGDNVLGVVLGHGRYNRAKSEWGEELALCSKLVIRYKDGNEQTVITDDTWGAYGNGPVRRDDLFWGEYYDANYEPEGWMLPEYDSKDWENASVLNDAAKLAISKKSFESEPVMCIDELSPVAVTEPEEGCFVYDFGQNFNGICRIVVEGEQGQVVTIRYAEALNEENLLNKDDTVGKIWTQNLYTAKNTDYYVMKGSGEEAFEPEFVCRGFRYVQITGLDSALDGENIKALVLSARNERTGYFHCSEEEVNTLYNNIYWTQLSNYADIPTDCPQRDERLAWAGDAQVFAPAAVYNSNIYTFMDRYLDALRAGQNDDGSIQDIGAFEGSWGGSNGWGDAIITIPWTLYKQYGNTQIIEENLDAMCRYMDYLIATSDSYIRYNEGYGDHNGVSYPESELSNTAQCARTADLLSRMCKAVGQEEAYEKYAQIFQSYRQAWQEKYINEDGSIGSWLPAEYTLGLAFGLYPEGLDAAGAERLNIVVEAQEFHMNTGYISTPFLLPILCEYGYIDSAYQLLMQDSYPSWNYMFSHGGTTITEAWWGYYEADNGYYGISGSLNHYALGSVAEWFYSDLLGIKADDNSAGFQHFILQPRVGSGIASVEGSYESMYGTIESSWHIEEGETVYNFVIPPNTSATVILPVAGSECMELEAGKYEFRG